MCGIAGIVAANRNDWIDEAVVRRMCDAIVTVVRTTKAFSLPKIPGSACAV